MKRRSITKAMRVALFTRKGGVCHMCGGLVAPGQLWDVSHAIPLALGGADDETNWDVAHRVCHKAETAAVDIPAIAKAKRREAKHIGAAPPAAKIQSPGFAKSTKTRHERASLPPRQMYTEIAS